MSRMELSLSPQSSSPKAFSALLSLRSFQGKNGWKLPDSELQRVTASSLMGVGGAAWHPRPALAPFVLGEQWQSSKCSLFIPSFLPDLWIRTILIRWNKEQLTGQGIY